MDTIPETGISKAETDALLAVNNANRKVLYSKKKKRIVKKTYRLDATYSDGQA